MTPKVVLIFASIAGFLAVALGAFGAHALKASLTPDQLSSWQTAVQYQFFHVLALLFVGALMMTHPSATITASAIAFMLGIILFCGSIYALVLSGPRILGPVTPLGGLSLMLGWALLAISVFKLPS